MAETNCPRRIIPIFACCTSSAADLNRQAAADQMWFAAGARAWHYDWDGEHWLCDKDGHELFARVSEVISDKIGRPVSIELA